jgi:hypothetical protein
MEAARTSETLVNFYQTTRRYNPEESHLRTDGRKNLKSYYPRIILEELRKIIRYGLQNLEPSKHETLHPEVRASC